MRRQLKLCRQGNYSTELFLINVTKEPDSDFDKLPSMMEINDSLPIIMITEDDIYKKLSALKIDKSPGMDLIHPRVLYETCDVTVRPLFLIYTRSIESGKLPSDWKLAEVTAVHKKGPKSDSGNYRPISLTSVCCKIIESLIWDYIMNYWKTIY